MAKTPTLLALALAACLPTAPDPGSFDLRGRDVALDDDGMQVAVTGCLSGIVGPCALSPGDTMTVAADGVTHDVPAVTVPPDPDVIGDMGEVVFQGAVPAPSDLDVEVVLAGEDGHFDLPPEFAITPPPAPVSRTASPLLIPYEVLPGATASADESITCATDTFELHDLAIETPGELVLSLDNYFLTGTCQHAIQLHQRIALPAGSALEGTAGRTESFELTSNP